MSPSHRARRRANVQPGGMKSDTAGTISTGITELDQRLGGVTPGRYYLLTGTPGAGKTSACLHFLAEGLRAGETCAILTQENADDLFAQAHFLGHDFQA